MEFGVNLPIKKKIGEEIGSGNCEPTLNKRSKTNNFDRLFIRVTVTKGRSPLHYHSRLKKTFVDERSEVGFSALTHLPPIVERGSSTSGKLLLPFVVGSLGHHAEIYQLL